MTARDCDLKTAARQAGAKDEMRVVASIQKACALGHMTPREALASLFKWQPALFYPRKAKEYFGGDA